MEILSKELVGVSRLATLRVFFVFVLIAPSSSLLLNVSAMNGGAQMGYQYAGYDVCASGTCGVNTFPSPYFTSIQGSFVVPNLVSCPASGLQYVHYAVKANLRNGAGIQFGCDTFPFYFVEVYKAGSVTGLGQAYAIHPGDHISVKITFNKSTRTLAVRVHDSTHIWTYTTGEFTDNYLSTSIDAEFYLIRDCTTSACPLPNFGTLKTSGDYVTIASGATSLKGALGHWWASTSSQSLYAAVYSSTMTDSDTGNTLARPTSITVTSTGFGIRWMAST
jgi:hypothetical protein